MNEIFEEEYDRFLQEINGGSMAIGRYVDENEYEDDYSNNEINAAKELFIEKTTKFLHKNYPGRYLVVDGWAIFVMTSERADETTLSPVTINELIIK